ncbi:MAG: PTS sugar transporter subunit IIC [Erysipelotrichaceae bacterium]|nr:PTS sugar transporter subunit IIC [Erysipelotrichaceae bacterium]
MNSFIEKVTNFATKLTQNKILRLIQMAFTSFGAVTLGSSIFNMIVSIPVPAYQTWIKASGVYDILCLPNTVVSNFMSVLVCLGAGYAFAQIYERPKQSFSYSVLGFISFLLVSDLSTTASIKTEAGETLRTTVANVLPSSISGPNGMLCALIITLIACACYKFFMDKGWAIKMPDVVPEMVSNMFTGMIPSCLTFCVIIAIRFLFKLTPFGTMQACIIKLLQAPLANVTGNIFGAIVYWTCIKLFWFIGLHGGQVTNGVFAAVTGVLTAANTAAFVAQEPIPYPEWALHALQASMGVAALTFLMCLFAKSEKYKALGKIALPISGAFNITEPIMFGAPIVFNFVLLIPFVLSPILTSLGMLGLMKLGLMNYPTGANISMFMPSPIGWALATADWKAALWSVVFYLLNMVLYYPFFKVADAQAVAEEKANAEAQANA